MFLNRGHVYSASKYSACKRHKLKIYIYLLTVGNKLNNICNQTRQLYNSYYLQKSMRSSVANRNKSYHATRCDSESVRQMSTAYILASDKHVFRPVLHVFRDSFNSFITVAMCYMIRIIITFPNDNAYNYTPQAMAECWHCPSDQLCTTVILRNVWDTVIWVIYLQFRTRL